MAKGNRRGHRRFGNIRRLPSGRYQVSYPALDGQRRYGPETFERKSDAERFLALIEVQIYHGEWTDPELGKVELQDYAERWITQRPGLRPRTSDLYLWLLRKHIAPFLGGVPLGKLSTAMIRQWRSELLGSGVSVSVAAKAYRLLRAVLTTAVEEDKILAAIRAESAELVTSRLGRGRCSPSLRSLSLPICSAVVLSATSAKSSAATGSGTPGTGACMRIQRSLPPVRPPSGRCGTWAATASPILIMIAVTVPWCCWRRSRSCGGVRRPHCADAISTWARVPSGCGPLCRAFDRRAGARRPEVTGWPPLGRHSRGDHPCTTGAPGDLCCSGTGRFAVHRHQGRAVAAKQLQQDVRLGADRANCVRPRRPALSRSSPHRESPCGGERRRAAGPDGPDGARQRTSRDHLPAPGSRCRSADHDRDRRAHPGRSSTPRW